MTIFESDEKQLITFVNISGIDIPIAINIPPIDSDILYLCVSFYKHGIKNLFIITVKKITKKIKNVNLNDIFITPSISNC